MATPSHITMLREISAAGDRERTGALDVEWDGVHVTLFFMFGHPSHVVLETTDGRSLVGEPALEAFVAELPAEFRVAPWRRAMVTDDTLHCTAEDLMGLFQRRNAAVESNGHMAEEPAPATPPPAAAFTAAAAVPPAPPATTGQPPFGLADFPLLPLATTLWTDAAANVINLQAALPRLPDSLIVLEGPTAQGAALIVGGRVTDAVWVNAAGGHLGDQAAHALMNSLEGSLTAYGVADPRILTALPMLWRAPRLGDGLPGAWLHTEEVVAEVRTSGRTCCLVVHSADPGVALFASGELVAVYTLGHRWPATSMAALRGMLHEPGARVSVLGEAAAQPATGAEATAVTEAQLEVADETEPQLDSSAEPLFAADPVDEPEAVDQTELEAVAQSVAEGVPQPEPAPHDEAAPDGAVVEAAAIEAPVDTGRRKGRRRARGRAANETVEAASPHPSPSVDAETAGVVESTDAEPAETATVIAVLPTAWREDGPGEDADPGQTDGEAVAAIPEPAAFSVDDLQFEAAPRQVAEVQFEPAVFTIADLAPEPTTSEPVAEPSGMAEVEAREATEFVPARLDIDVDALRTELTDIATVWLGQDDAAPVAQAIDAARPGVDDFVSTIRAIGAMEIPGHESAVVRAMAREMHFRASEVLCGV